ncbi:hypothetical protein ABPG72_006758 [Tetrahymena utriculariae]
METYQNNYKYFYKVNISEKKIELEPLYPVFLPNNVLSKNYKTHKPSLNIIIEDYYGDLIITNTGKTLNDQQFKNMALFLGFLVYLNSFCMNREQSIALLNFSFFINKNFINPHYHKQFENVHLLLLILTQSLVLVEKSIIDILNQQQFQAYFYLITRDFVQENKNNKQILELFKKYFKLNIQEVKDQNQQQNLKDFDMQLCYQNKNKTIAIKIKQYPNKQDLKLYQQLTFFQNIFESQLNVCTQISDKLNIKCEFRFNCPFTGILVSIIHSNYIQSLQKKDNQKYLHVIHQIVNWFQEVKRKMYDQFLKDDYQIILNNIVELKDKFFRGLEVYQNLLVDMKTQNSFEFEEIAFNKNNLMIFPFIFYVIYNQEMYQFYSDREFSKWDILSKIANQITKSENLLTKSAQNTKNLFYTEEFQLKYNTEFENILNYQFKKNTNQFLEDQRQNQNKNQIYNSQNFRNSQINEYQQSTCISTLQDSKDKIICKECYHQIAEVFISNLNICKICLQKKFQNYI